MTSFVFVAPGPVPSPPADLWPGVTIGWDGWDGSRWTFCGAEGVSLLRGVRGFELPPIERWATTIPSAAGSRYRGHRIGERTVFWPLKVYQPASSQAWIERDRAFWKTLQPDRTGVWWVEQPDGTRRTLTLRVTETDDRWDFSPGLMPWHTYGIDLVAEDPMWKGTLETRAFAASTGQPFFGGDEGEGFGPPFFISESSTLATAHIANPGDVAAWPQWWIGESQSSSVGGVVVPFEVAPGKLLVIDESPLSQAAILIDLPASDEAAFADLPLTEQRDRVRAALPNGTNVTRQLGAGTRFSPVKPGASVDLDITMTGSGFVRVLLEPLYYRAW